MYEDEWHEEVFEEKVRDINAHFETESSHKEYPADKKMAIIVAMTLQAFQSTNGILIIFTYGIDVLGNFFTYYDQIMVLLLFESFVCSLVGPILLSYSGRRSLELKGIFCMGLSMMGLSVGFFNEVDSQFMEVFVLICLFSFVSSFILTQGTIVFVYVPEVIQPPMVTISTVVSWSSAILVTVSFPLIREKSENPSLPQAFLVYSLLAFVTFFICCKWMVETKDKTELEIREEFQALEE